MGWADDMYEAGYTSEHGGLMADNRGFGSGAYSPSIKSKGRNHGKPWTAAARYHLASRYAEGRSVDEIAQEFKRTRYAIAWQLFNMNKITKWQRECFRS